MTIRYVAIFASTLLFSGISAGQVVTGIGDFRVDMTEEAFLELPLIKEKKLREKKEFFEEPTERELLRTSSGTKLNSDAGSMPDSVLSSMNSLEGVFSPDILRYEFMSPLGVPSIGAKDSYQIKVVFYKNKLGIISVKASPNFKEILTEKYGKPTVSGKINMVICQNKFGAKSEELDGTEKLHWAAKNRIGATLTRAFSNCGRDMLIGYSVENFAVNKVIAKIQTDAAVRMMHETTKSDATRSKL